MLVHGKMSIFAGLRSVLRYWVALGWVGCLGAADPAQEASGEVLAQVFCRGETLPLVIEASPGAGPAAEVLRKRLEASLGQRVLEDRGRGGREREREREDGKVFRIHVGQTPYVETLGLDFATLHPFGYFIRLVDGENLVLTGSGKSPTADEYAVYDFLKRFMGYRYFAPGEWGEVTPRHARIELPDTLDDREEPSILSYTNAGFAGGNGGFSRSWRTTLYATHALGRIVPVAKFGKTHPEYYPMYDGQRFIPGEKLGGTWQPCVSNPDLPGLAIQWAKTYFKENPTALGFPLGVNDGGGDCRCPECLKAKAAYGNQYIPFYNETARLAKAAFPGKYVGFIAYGGARPAPRNITLEDNLLVEVTGGMAEDMRQFREWRAAGIKHFGLYDYFYGGGYVVPRHYPRLMAQAWRTVAKEFGLLSLWGESFIKSWIFDGPRQYVLNELAWNLDAPVESLLTDYFDNFYGPASTPMRAVFDRLEDIYTRKREALYPIADWKDWHQFAEFTTDDLTVIRAHLDKARVLAKDDAACARRVGQFVKLWGLSELFVRSFLATQEMTNLSAGDPRWHEIADSGYALFQQIEDFSLSAEEEKSLLVNSSLAQYKGHERLKMRSTMDSAIDEFLGRTRAKLGGRMDAFLEGARVLAPQTRLIVESHQREAHQEPGTRQDVFALPPSEPARARSSDWESLSETMPGWSTWHFPNSKTVFEISDRDSPGGRPSMIIRQNDIRGSFLRAWSVQPGEVYRIRLRVRQDVGEKPGSLHIRWKDQRGQWLPSEDQGSQSPVSQQFPEPTGQWQAITRLFAIPDGADAMIILLSAPVQDDTRATAFHDVALYKIHDAQPSAHP